MASYLAHRPALDLRREIDQLFENFLSPGGAMTPRGTDEFRVALEMTETDDAYKLNAEVPGMSPDDIEVQVDQGVLSIRGEKQRRTSENIGGVNYSEFNYGTFMRSVQLPPGIDPSKIEAKVDNGILTVIVPKGEAARPRRIPLAGASQQGRRQMQPPLQAGQQPQQGQQVPQGQQGQQVPVRGDGGKADQTKSAGR